MVWKRTGRKCRENGKEGKRREEKRTKIKIRYKDTSYIYRFNSQLHGLAVFTNRTLHEVLQGLKIKQPGLCLRPRLH